MTLEELAILEEDIPFLEDAKIPCAESAAGGAHLNIQRIELTISADGNMQCYGVSNPSEVWLLQRNEKGNWCPELLWIDRKGVYVELTPATAEAGARLAIKLDSRPDLQQPYSRPIRTRDRIAIVPLRPKLLR